MLIPVLEKFMPPSVHANKALENDEPLFLMALVQASDERINALVADTFETEPYRMITSRFAAYPRAVGTRLKLFINIMSETRGQVSLWVAIIQYLAWKRNVDMYTIEMFCEDFPNGIYSDEQFSAMWKAQKVNGNFNMVDMIATQTELLARPQEIKNGTHS